MVFSPLLKMKIAASIIVLFLCLSCKKLEYSPYQNEPSAEELPSDLNNKNLDKLKATEGISDDTVTILFTGDSQRFYEELEDLVKKVNGFTNIDFLIIAGDIADFGLMKEYQWINEELFKLNIPFFCAIGNHDLAMDKGELFTNIYGPKNWSFNYKGYKFLFHDTNGREYNFNGSVPDLNWMAAELKDENAKWFVGVSHMAPYNGDFDAALSGPYQELLASYPKFIGSLHGHEHQSRDIKYEEVRYLTANSLDKRKATIVKLINGEILTQNLEF